MPRQQCGITLSKSHLYRKVQKSVVQDLAHVESVKSEAAQLDLCFGNNDFKDTSDLSKDATEDAFTSHLNYDLNYDHETSEYFDSTAFPENNDSEHTESSYAPTYVTRLVKTHDSQHVSEPLSRVAVNSCQDFVASQFEANGLFLDTDNKEAECAPSSSLADESYEVTLCSGLKDWALQNKVKHTVINSLLKVLQPFHPLPGDARTLLKTSRSEKDGFTLREMAGAEFMYMGLEDNLKWMLSCLSYPVTSQLSLSFNIDGQSPFKNTKDQLWPILCYVEEFKQLKTGPFLVGAYYGRKKPPVDDYLREFVQDLSFLSIHGLVCPNGLRYEIRIHSFVCDAPAAAYVKCIKGHGGFYGCARCGARGISVDGCRVFLKLNETLRTDNNFRRMIQEAHHHDVSPLTALSIDMVLDFPLDPMHLLYLGCVKRVCKALKEGVPNWVKKRIRERGRFLTIWVKKQGKRQRKKGKLPTAAIQAIDARILSQKKLWPSDFSRNLRSFSDFDLWKATECRQFLLYAAPIVLKGILEKERYNHLLLLHAAARILSSDQNCKSTLVDEALVMLRRFVRLCPDLYGPQFTVYNVHSLIHIVDDVRKYGCLENYSAFKFENYQRELRDLLRGTYRPLQQIRNRLLERRSLPSLLKSSFMSETPLPVYQSEHSKGPTCGLNGRQFSKVSMLGTSLSSSEKDNTVLLDCGTVIMIENFVSVESVMYVVGRAFCYCKDFYTSPLKSAKVSVKVVARLSLNVSAWPITAIVGKSVILKYKSRKIAMGLLHV